MKIKMIDSTATLISSMSLNGFCGSNQCQPDNLKSDQRRSKSFKLIYQVRLCLIICLSLIMPVTAAISSAQSSNAAKIVPVLSLLLLDDDSTPIASPGSSVTLSGSIDTNDRQWNRLSSICDDSSDIADHYYDSFAITNTTASTQTLTVTAAWLGDGYLHALTDPLDVSDTANCIVGDDDFGGTSGSRITSLTIAAGQTLHIIASTFSGNDPIGDYEIEVLTDAAIAPPGSSIALSGSIDENDQQWNRLNPICEVSLTTNNYYDSFAITNTTANTQTLTVTAAWSGDGYLHAFADPLDVSNAANCIVGDDDFGGTSGSRITNLTIAAGQTLHIIASSFSGNNPIGNYDIEVLTDAAIAPPGSSITLIGSIDTNDRQWNRLTPDCEVSFRIDQYYDSFAITNTTANTQTLTITAAWSGDGHLHVFTDPLDVSNTANCLVGDDDFGGTSGSQIANLTIAAGHTLHIIASTFFGNDPIGAYDVEVLTLSN